ncbi:MAG: FecR domain-containing protein [Bacteroidota bacterium]|nr:FecR domain-containing protein [Bacteroidota bacterium]
MNTEDDFRNGSTEELAKRIAYLINGYMRDKLTASEHEELDEWVAASMRNQQLFEELTDPANISKWMKWKEKLDSKAALKKLRERLGIKKKQVSAGSRNYWLYGLVAASVLGAIIIGIYRIKKTETPQIPIAASQKDLPPGGKHAVLVMDNGPAILLDTLNSGDVIPDRGIRINTDSACLNYSVSELKNIQTRFDKLTTPAGGEYEVRLSDGTRVWLNAFSTLKYPEQFSDSVRKVELTGEAYFEVANDAVHPFIVLARDHEVRVLGTHFDVNNYPDNQNIVVTLAEGSVNLDWRAILKPGQEGRIDPVGKIATGPADLEMAMAWKEGQFIFKMIPLEEVMKQVSHWYNAKIVYQDNITEHFNARIPRNVSVSRLLHLLEATGQVHFKIEDRIITVMN